MWRDRARWLGRSSLRFVLWLGLGLLLLSLPMLAVLGSEGGSRWLLERGLGMQQMATASYRSGTLLTGLELADVHVKGRKFDLYIRHVLARWSLLQLFMGKLELQDVQAEGLRLRLTAAPSAGPVRLPTLVIPVRLQINSLQLRDAALYRWQQAQPLRLQALDMAGRWYGYRVTVGRLRAQQEDLGELSLSGRINLRGNYALGARGQLALKPFQAQAWQPLQVQLAGDLAALQLQLASSGPLQAQGRTTLDVLDPQLPFVAHVRWQKASLPWWPGLAIQSGVGELTARGSKQGLSASGHANLRGRHLPAGQYVMQGRTDFHSAQIDSFKFSGLLGEINAKSHVDWRSGLSWELEAGFTGLDLRQHWSELPWLLPKSNGRLHSRGHSRGQGSLLQADLTLAQGERWQLQDRSASWLWQLQKGHELELGWRGVARSLPGLGAFKSAQGQLRLTGGRDAYTLKLGLDAAADRLPPGRWSAQLSGAGPALSLQELSYRGDAGAAQMSGQLKFGPTINWQGMLQLDEFSSAWLGDKWSGQFSGLLHGKAYWGKRQQGLALQEVRLQGRFQDRPLHLQGPLQLQLAPSAWPQFHSPGLQLDWGEDRLSLQGGLGKESWDLQAELKAGDVARWGAPLQGALAGHVQLQGARRQPDIVADLKGQGLKLAGVGAQQASLQLDIRQLGLQDSQAQLLLDGLTIASAASPDRPLSLGQLALELSGRQPAHRLQWQLGGERFYGQGSWSGALEAAHWRWQGQMDTGQISMPGLDWLLAEATPLRLDVRQRQLELGAHCWLSQAASLCSEENLQLGAQGRLSLRLQGLAAERLNALLPEGLGVSGAVDGRAQASWQPAQAPQLSAQVQARQGALELARDDSPSSLILPYEALALDVQADAKAVNLRLGLDSRALGQGRFEARVDPWQQPRTLQGQVDLQGLRLDVLQPFFPELTTLAGVVSAQGRLQGSLQRPEFWGQLRLADGALALHRLPVNLHGIRLALDVQGQQADVQGELHSGRGQARVTGQAQWRERPQLDMRVQGEQFELRQPPELEAEVEPDLRLRLVPGQLDIGGLVRVPTARLLPKSLLDSKRVALSDDVHIIDAPADRSLRVQGMSRGGLRINADVLLRLGDDVFFHGYGVNGRLLGGLRLRQQDGRALEANGEVELDKDARYDAYGQRLRIRRGRLIFAGNLLQPGLDVEAVREVDSQVVGLRVEGRANAPEVSFFSDGGGLSQEEILSYLVLGRPLDTSNGKEGPNLSAAAAAIKLGATGGAGLTSKVGDSLGITDLAVDAEGNGDDTQFTVSGYISPKLYLRYGVGIFTPVNTATLRYKINARLYLEAVSSLDSAIDLFYNFKF